jgi:hypothetical protein
MTNDHEPLQISSNKIILFLYYFTGGCFGATTKKTIVGGWTFAWWLVTDVQRLSLEVRKFYIYKK